MDGTDLMPLATDLIPQGGDVIPATFRERAVRMVRVEPGVGLVVKWYTTADRTERRREFGPDTPANRAAAIHYVAGMLEAEQAAGGDMEIWFK